MLLIPLVRLSQIHVLCNHFRLVLERLGIPDAIGDIAHVTGGGGVVAFENRTVEIRLLAALDRGNEVREMASGTLELLDELARFVVGDGSAVVGADRDKTFGA